MNKSLMLALSSAILFLLLTFTVFEGEASNKTADVALREPSTSIAQDKAAFDVLSHVTLNADGENKGLSAYELIRRFYGPRPIESPDLFPENHPNIPHITEAFSDVVGKHFVFKIHRDIDKDRGRKNITDRQRNEIKAYNHSIDALKGFEHETLIYQWKFKVNDQMKVSKKFTHLFQLKAKGGSDKQPILTITGSKRRSGDGIEVRHFASRQNKSILARVDWQEVTGEWIEVYCRVTYSDASSMRLIAKRIRDGKAIFDIEVAKLDLWRGTETDHFVRPKWGIYRSLLDLANLRSAEETVSFANFEVSKMRLK